MYTLEVESLHEFVSPPSVWTTKRQSWPQLTSTLPKRDTTLHSLQKNNKDPMMYTHLRKKYKFGTWLRISNKGLVIVIRKRVKFSLSHHLTSLVSNPSVAWLQDYNQTVIWIITNLINWNNTKSKIDDLLL